MSTHQRKHGDARYAFGPDNLRLCCTPSLGKNNPAESVLYALGEKQDATTSKRRATMTARKAITLRKFSWEA